VRAEVSFVDRLRAYPRSFWVANLSELFERLAFYGMTPVLVLYLTGARGFSNQDAIRLSGNFGFVVYALPVAAGFLADWMGYRRAMLLAYASLAVGYLLTGLAVAPAAILGALLLVAFGASVIKPSITGTVQNSCDDASRAVGFSIYYTLVNIGGWLGPLLSGQVAERLGIESVFRVSAAGAVVAFLLVAAGFREPKTDDARAARTPAAFARDAIAVLADVRLVLLFVFVAGFWSMFFQFFGALPLYLTQDLGASVGISGLVVSLDAFSIICFQVAVGHLVRNMAPFKAILAGIIVASAGVALMGARPVVLLAAVGVLVFSLGEMMYSAHFYHYMGNLAPKGKVGMYMGFAFLPIAVGSLLAGQIGGPIAAHFRDTLGRPQWMWPAFAAVGFASAAGLALLTRLKGDRSLPGDVPDGGT
jgi:dipeptide/tripeptide permease